MPLLSYILEKTEGMNKAAFLKSHPRPALYFAANTPNSSSLTIRPEENRSHPDTPTDEATDTDSVEILTKVENLRNKQPSDLFTETSHQGIRQFRNKASIFFLTKDHAKIAASPPQLNDADMITLGRDGYNDIVLADTMVSKNHALFISLPNRNRWVILDRDSTNGTQVDQFQLKGRLPHLLKNKSTIIFAKKFQAIFMQAEIVWDFLCHERNIQNLKQ